MLSPAQAFEIVKKHAIYSLSYVRVDLVDVLTFEEASLVLVDGHAMTGPKQPFAVLVVGNKIEKDDMTYDQFCKEKRIFKRIKENGHTFVHPNSWKSNRGSANNNKGGKSSRT